MKQLIETDQLIGKKIKAVFGEFEEQIIFCFTDDSFVVIVDDRDKYENSNTELILSGEIFNLQPNRNNYRELHKYGMINDFVFNELDVFFKQLDADEAEEKARVKANEEIWKLQQLAQKYPHIATLNPLTDD